MLCSVDSDLWQLFVGSSRYKVVGSGFLFLSSGGALGLCSLPKSTQANFSLRIHDAELDSQPLARNIFILHIFQEGWNRLIGQKKDLLFPAIEM